MPLSSSRLRTSLAADVARLHTVAARDLSASVPTCPDWVVDDLVRHVANGLRNVALRRVRGQDPIMKPEPTDADPLAALDSAHTDFVTELALCPLDELACQPPRNAHTPAETAYFWLRRMTHEIAVHRADAELALHEPVTTVPPELATDGITEMLELFLRYASHENPERYADLLTDPDERWLLLTAGEGRWRITITRAGVDTAVSDDSAVTDDSAMTNDSGDAPATVSGEPTALLLWLYNRGNDITTTGDSALIARTRDVLDRAMSG